MNLGMWIAFIGNAEGGDPDRIVARCLSAGIKWLAVKSGDSDRNKAWSLAAQRLVKKAHDAGLKIYTWNYSVPGTWRRQILQIESVFADGVDGHIVDAELEWETGGDHHADAQAFVDALKIHFPDKWLAHAPFAWCSYHPSWPYAQFAKLNAVCPQAYWTEHDDHGALATCAQVDAEWAKMQGQPSFQPIGVTYGAGTGWGKPPGAFHGSDLLQFLAHYQKCDALSLYSMEAAMPECWSTLEGLQTGLIKLPDPPLTMVQIQNKLGIKADGIRGPQTVAAIKSFQMAHNLVPDGIVGPLTEAALRN